MNWWFIGPVNDEARQMEPDAHVGGEAQVKKNSRGKSLKRNVGNKEKNSLEIPQKLDVLDKL